MWEIAKKPKISYNGVYYSLQRTAQMGSNQNRKRSRRPRCTTKQEEKYIRISSLRNRRLTGPQLAASLNGTRKTPVSTSTWRGNSGMRIWDLKEWAKEHRHWTEEDWKMLWTDKSKFEVFGWHRRTFVNKWKDAGGVPDAICQAWWR